MSMPENPDRPKKSWTRALAPALGIAAAGFYSSSYPSDGSVSFTKAAIAGAIGGMAALVGYGVGKLIDAARE